MMKQVRVFLVGLALAVILVFGITGYMAVSRAADYREMTAPKNLHQMAMETRENPNRGMSLVVGGGLFAMFVLGGGVLLFAARTGTAFGRSAGRKRRRRPTRPANGTVPSVPRMSVLPPVTSRPALPASVAEEGYYEDL